MPELGPICLIFGRRAGTSSLARDLFHASYPLRGPLDCRPFPAQPDGHYENTFARGINQGILDHFNLKPGVPGLVPFQICQPLGNWADRHEGPFIVKDPGLDMTWPVWVRTLTPRKLVGIWCDRDPEARKESLRRNYAIPPQNAHWAVAMYDLCINAATKHIQTIRVDLADPSRNKLVQGWLHVAGIFPDPAYPQPERILEHQNQQNAE